MRALWICGLPLAVQRLALQNEDHGAQAAWSWILAHLPPPADIDLHIACIWPGGTRRKDFDFEGAHFHLLPCPRRARALLLFQRDTAFFRPLFEELRSEIVHGWGTEDSYGLVARRLAPVRHLIGIQGLINAYRARLPMERRTMLTAFTERLTLRRARWVVAESEYSVRVARPFCPRADIAVVEHPLRREFLEAEPADGSAKTVLFVGSVSERKGISDALRAFAEAAPAEWKMQVIGNGAAPEEAAMRELARQLGIDGRFRHDGGLPASEIVRQMQQSAVFLLPTRIDTGPTALKEALTLGLWPVCYDSSGPGEYIRSFRFGTLSRDLDVSDLTRRLRDALQQCPWRDPSLRAELRQRTRATFSPEQIWSQLRRRYEQIIRAAGPA